MNRLPKLLFLLTTVLFTLQVQAAGVAWRSYSNQVFADAKRSHKSVLIYGKASWCPYCQRMNSTFQNSAISNMINANFIPVMVDVDDNRKVAMQYDISTLPTIIILNENKSVVNTIIGYQDVSDIKDKLKSYVRR